MDITHLFESLGFPIAIVAVLMWWQMQREKRADTRQQLHEETALAREMRLAERVTMLEGMVHEKLMDIVESTTTTHHTISDSLNKLNDTVTKNQMRLIDLVQDARDTQKSIASALEETVKNNTERTQRLHQEIRSKPCLLSDSWVRAAIGKALPELPKDQVDKAIEKLREDN